MSGSTLPSIGVIGNGVVGSAVANVYRSTAYNVKIYDSDDRKAVNTLQQTLSSDIVFICLPELVIERFITEILYPSFKHTNIVIKSTVLVGTTERLSKQYGLKMIHSPEFLSTNTAMYDAWNPKRLIIGIPPHILNTNEYPSLIFHLYKSRFPSITPIVMRSNESELVKLLDNAFGAMKVSIFNEFKEIADKSNTNWPAVLNGLLAGGRIGKDYTQVPGYDGKYGWGGNCWPKDTEMLRYYMQARGIDDWMISAAITRNEEDRNK